MIVTEQLPLIFIHITCKNARMPSFLYIITLGIILIYLILYGYQCYYNYCDPEGSE